MNTLYHIIINTSIIYTVLIFIVVLSSWIPIMESHPILQSILTFARHITDPLLNAIRKALPPLNFSGISLDLSPIVAIIAISILTKFIIWLIF